MAYIKLEDLKKYPIRINHYDKDNGNRDFVLGVESVIEYAESLPTADVEEVVRCKDCDIPHNKWTGCPKLNGLITPPDFFCGHGERRDT